jgi:hypothetical protein
MGAFSEKRLVSAFLIFRKNKSPALSESRAFVFTENSPRLTALR